jgi:16S rRNA (guanine966-N2)-methyltransferase
MAPLRIVAGTLRGRPLATPSDMGIRPTSDRVREAMFNIIAHGLDGIDLEGARVLDLFAGTGALGIEALSRGAKFCLFVEDGPEARGLIRQNVEAFGLTGVTKIFRRDATDLGPADRQGAFTIAFLDPPYGKGLAELALASAARGGWLTDGALCVVEEAKDADLQWPAGFVQFEQRSWGDTTANFLRFKRGG